MPATLPASVAVEPTVVTPPATVVEEVVTPPERQTAEVSKATGNKVIEVEHDWEPVSIADKLAEGLGEIRRKPAPGAEKKEDTKVEAKTDAKPDAKAEPADEKELEKVTATEMAQAGIKPGTQQAHAFQKVKRERWQAQQDAKAAKDQLESFKTKAEEAETLRARLAELEKAPKIDPDTERKLKEHEELSKRIEDYEGRLAVTAVERSDRFQRAIAKPLANLEKFMGEIATEYEIKPGDVITALQKTGKDRRVALEELTADMSNVDRLNFIRAAGDYEGVLAEKEEILADAKNKAAQLEAEAAAQREQSEAERGKLTAKQRAEWDELVPKKWEEVTKLAGVGPIEGNADWNSRLEAAARFAAETPFDDLEVPDRVEAMHRAAVYPFLLGKLSVREKTIAALEERLARYERATPGAGSGNRKTERTVDDAPKTSGGFTSAVDKAFAEAGIG